MMDIHCNSTGMKKNHKDFIAKSVESSVGLEHRTQQKNQISHPHTNVHRVHSKDLDVVFGETDAELNK